MSGLFNSTVLDVAIGLVFVYLLLAIMCTTINEWIAGVLKTRAKMLEKGIKQLLDNQGAPSKSGDKSTTQPGGTAAAQKDPNEFLQEFYKHPLVAGMNRDGSHPSYLSARTFSTVVMDIATAAHEGSIEYDQLQDAIKALPPGDVRTALLALVQNANKDLATAQKAIEGWFDDTMDRVSGWYKRHSQIRTVIIAVVVTVATNADTIHIVRHLRADPVLRTAIVEDAKIRAQQPRPSSSVEYIDNDPTKPVVEASDGDKLSAKDREMLGEIIGWQTGQGSGTSDWFWRIIGWILTAIAVSLGAPFWFDLLNRFMNLRNAGKSPDEGPKGPAKKPEKQG